MADGSDTYTFDGLDLLLKIIHEQAALRARAIPDPGKAGEYLISVDMRTHFLATYFLPQMNHSVKETIETKVPVTLAFLIAKMRRQLVLMGKDKKEYVQRAEECLDEMEKGLLSLYLDPAKEQEHQEEFLAAVGEMCSRAKGAAPEEGIRAHTSYNKKIIESLWNCVGEPLTRQTNVVDVFFGMARHKSEKGDTVESWSHVAAGVWDLYLLFLPVFIDPLSDKPDKVPPLLCQLITDLMHYVKGLEDYPLRKTKAVIYRRLREVQNPDLEQLYGASAYFFITRNGPHDEAIMYPYTETVKRKGLKVV
jgi:hypothetical protein